jgi:hypothetical protein
MSERPGRRQKGSTIAARRRWALGWPARLGAGLGGLFLAASLGGCVEFGHGETKTADNVTDTKPEVVRAPANDRGTAELKGTVLTVTATARCDLVEMETVEQVSKSERKFEDDMELPIGLLEGFAAVPIGAGIGLLADSPNVYDSDPNQRLYNSTGHDSVVTTGAVLVALGAAAAIWPTIELIRSGVPETSTSTTTRQGNVLQRNVPCRADQTASGHAISLRYAGGSTSIGSTDASGKLVVDLKQVLPITLFQAPVPPVSMGVWIDSQFVTDIGVASLGLALIAEREQQDDLAWRVAEADACAGALNETVCAGVRRYLSTFPQGRHAAEANALVAKINAAATGTSSGQVTIAAGPADELLQRAVTEAQAAAEKAMEAAQAKADAAALKAEEATAKQILQAGHEACVRTCEQVCAANRACRKSCKEQCQ